MRFLAEVVPVIPRGSPDWWEDSSGNEMPGWPSAQPMACGPWWWVGRDDKRVLLLLAAAVGRPGVLAASPAPREATRK